MRTRVRKVALARSNPAWVTPEQSPPLPFPPLLALSLLCGLVAVGWLASRMSRGTPREGPAGLVRPFKSSVETGPALWLSHWLLICMCGMVGPLAHYYNSSDSSILDSKFLCHSPAVPVVEAFPPGGAVQSRALTLQVNPGHCGSPQSYLHSHLDARVLSSSAVR